MKNLITTIAIAAISICTSAQDIKIKDINKEREGNKVTELGAIDENTIIYLRGSFNNWDTSIPFKRISDGIYCIEDITLFNGRDGMKIGSEDWKTVDVGGIEKELPLGTDNKLKVGGENIFISGISGQQTIRLSKITLDINKMTIKAEKASKMYPHISLDVLDDTEFMTDEMLVNVSFNLDTESGSIKVIGKNTQRDILVKNNVSIKLGKQEPTNSTIEVICTANASDGTTATDTIRYVKSEATGIYVYFNNPSNWENTYCYLWSLRGDQNYPWPGEKMEWDGEIEINGQKGWWKTQVSKRYSDFGEVIFNNNDGLQTAEDLSMDGEAMVYDGIEWKKLAELKQ